ncbi:MAG: hypothetical protein ACR2QW_14990 [bacterium]
MRGLDRPVLNKRYDLTGNTVLRQLRHWFRMKTSTMGNYDTGPGLLCMLKLGVLHYFGRPLFRVRIWLRNQYALKARVRRVIAKFR